MIIISKAQWDDIPADYKGEYRDYWGDHPEWIGRKVVMSTCVTHNPDEVCSLLVEGVHFVIEHTKGGEN